MAPKGSITLTSMPMALPTHNHSASTGADGTPETSADSQSRQPRPHVCKVILHVSQPSALETPAAMPVPPAPPEDHRPPQTPPLLLLPPPKDHCPPQTPLLPPPPPSHLLPSGAGLPIPINGQYSSAMNTPPSYTHPYSVTFYPPTYPPAQHYSPYGASISAAPFQPWGYAQYPMAPPPTLPSGPFLAHPLATQCATAGDEDPPACKVCGHMQDIPMHGDTGVTGTDGSVDANIAAPSSTVGAQLGRPYPNKEVSNGGERHIPLRWKIRC